MNEEMMGTGLAAMLVHDNPEKIAKIAGGIYKDYDYGATSPTYIGGHYSDRGKLPNHPTFSEESMYSGDKYRGGVWKKDSKGRDVFVPSPDMIREGATKGLAEYFKIVEPTGAVEMPAPYSINNIK